MNRRGEGNIANIFNMILVVGAVFILVILFAVATGFLIGGQELSGGKVHITDSGLTTLGDFELQKDLLIFLNKEISFNGKREKIREHIVDFYETYFEEIQIIETERIFSEQTISQMHTLSVINSGHSKQLREDLKKLNEVLEQQNELQCPSYVFRFGTFQVGSVGASGYEIFGENFKENYLGVWGDREFSGAAFIRLFYENADGKKIPIDIKYTEDEEC